MGARAPLTSASRRPTFPAPTDPLGAVGDGSVKRLRLLSTLRPGAMGTYHLLLELYCGTMGSSISDAGESSMVINLLLNQTKQRGQDENGINHECRSVLRCYRGV